MVMLAPVLDSPLNFNSYITEIKHLKFLNSLLIHKKKIFHETILWEIYDSKTHKLTAFSPLISF